ncbi:MAG: hypothetical protein IT181_27950, partial [Acidobacteria bacterium]|nr:hypothetical protein [Acidobacteriota bacterium]
PSPVVSVAVLPLADGTNGADMAPVVDGLTDALTNDLARFAGLRVTARSSAFVFRDSAQDPRTVGQALGAEYLLQGRVAAAGERLQVYLRLVRSADGSESWSRAFVVPAASLFQLASRVSRDVAGVVGVPADPAGTDAASAPPRPRNPKAFDAYIRALYAHRTTTLQGWNEAARSADECTRLEPAFAGCFTMKGVALFSLMTAAAASADPAMRAAAEGALRTALSLDPNDGLAHANLGGMAMLFDLDWPRAKAHYEMAMRLSPLAAEAYAGGLLLAGRAVEAEAFYLRAKDVDPMSLAIRMKLALTYGMTRRLDEAFAALDDVERMSPENPAVWMQRAWLQIQDGDLAAARSTLARTRARVPQLPELLLAEAWVAAAAGESGGMAAIEAWDATYGRYAPYAVGLAYLHAGRVEIAARRILDAVATRDARAAYIVLDPALDPLRRRPEFRAIWDAVPNLTTDAAYPGGWPPAASR